jgi:hypothetical protein
VYNKLFTKILDSSIWLETTPTRIVWLTFIACMDESGFVQFAAIGNVANRARVTLEEAQEAIKALENPDPESGDPDHEGRRIERVPGGWMVLNAEKHRQLVTRAVIQEQTRIRVRRHREKKRNSNAPETPSEARSEARSEEKNEKSARVFGSNQMSEKPTDEVGTRAAHFIERYTELYPIHRHGAKFLPKPALDYQTACELVKTWPDERLEKLVIIFLKTDHDFAASGSRTIRQFAALASWCDGRLAEVEKDRKVR